MQIFLRNIRKAAKEDPFWPSPPQHHLDSIRPGDYVKVRGRSGAEYWLLVIAKNLQEMETKSMTGAPWPMSTTLKIHEDHVEDIVQI